MMAFAPVDFPSMSEVATHVADNPRTAHGAAVFSRRPNPAEVFGQSRLRDPLRLLPAAGTQPLERWDATLEGIESVSNLEEDWDGEGSPKPGKGTLRMAIHVVMRMAAIGVRPPDRVVPGVNGTVLFVWSTATGYVELEATESGIEYFVAQGVLVRPESA